MTGHVPLRVTAHLEAGVAQAAPWGIALDGLLAGVIHQRAKSALLEAGRAHQPLAERDDVDDLDLPLARCARGEDWHWACTCAQPVDGQQDMPDVRYWLGAADPRDLEEVAEAMPGRLEIGQGRYRQHYMPLLTTVTSAVTWDAVGDPDIIRDLVQNIWAIGKKRAAGQGRVLRWEVHPTDREPWEAGHLHPDGAVGRPTPSTCLPPEILNENRHGGIGWAGLRAPYHHRSRQRRLVLPQLLDG